MTHVIDDLRAAVLEAVKATTEAMDRETHARKLLLQAIVESGAKVGAVPSSKRRGRGPSAEDLTGRRSGRQRDGVLQVLHYLSPASNSPWWQARCRACKAEHPYQGHRLRNYRPACRSCGTA